MLVTQIKQSALGLRDPVAEWLQRNHADDNCGVLRLPAESLRTIVAARCALRARREVPLKSGREADPCVCGCLAGWHAECYWWFARENKSKPATENNALPWRRQISQNAI